MTTINNFCRKHKVLISNLMDFIKGILVIIATPIILGVIAFVLFWLWNIYTAYTLIFKVYGDEELLQDIKITVVSQTSFNKPLKIERLLDKGKTQIVTPVSWQGKKADFIAIYISYKDELVGVIGPREVYKLISHGYVHFNHLYVSKDRYAINVEYITTKDKRCYLCSYVTLIPKEEFYKKSNIDLQDISMHEFFIF